MSNRNRDITLDVMKSLLVIGMITAHVVQLCYVGGSKLVALFSLFINVVTFSSFMFCFGCASWLAYFRKYHTFVDLFLYKWIWIFVAGGF